MSDLQKMEQEKSVLRWGGLAGILGGILFIAALFVSGLFVGADPADLAGWVTRFPDIRAVRIVENGVYLAGLLLETFLFVALFWALRKESLAPALFGTVMGVLGLAAMAISAIPHVAHTPLSELYHTPGMTAADQATLALLWQAVWGVFNAMLYIGFMVVPIGLILDGVAMFGVPAFGKGLSRFSVALGAIGLVAAIVQMIDPDSMIGVLNYLGCIVVYLVLGSKIYRLSRAP